jgi:hypothetical protein
MFWRSVGRRDSRRNAILFAAALVGGAAAAPAHSAGDLSDMFDFDHQGEKDAR